LTIEGIYITYSQQHTLGRGILTDAVHWTWESQQLCPVCCDFNICWYT